MGAHALGAVFFGWGLMVAVFSVFVAPRVRDALGVVGTLTAMYAFMAATLVVMALGEASPAVLGRRHLAAAEIESVPGQLRIRPLRTAGART